jgi:pyruvate-formate lyase-activating enzyme
MFHEHTYCILPWSSIQINPSGDLKICCFSGVSSDTSAENNHGMCLDDDGNVMNILTHSIKDALNSKYHKELRLAQSNNERHPMCKVCWDRDDANKNQYKTSLRYYRSFRQLQNLDGAIPLHEASNRMNDDGSIDSIPISLDLRFTNVCNMKCVMCSSIYSNQWYEDEVKLYNTTSFAVDSKVYSIRVENGVYKTDMPVWHDSPIWWEKFDEIKNQIRHIYLTGGEPFIIKGHDILLDKLIECGVADKVILQYDTNLSVINDKILNRLVQFKEVLIDVSCDDIGERYEFIRYGGKFKTLIDNLDKLKSKNIKFRNITSCVGIYSLFSPIRVHEFFSQMGYDEYAFRVLRSPWHSDVAFLPDDLKMKVIKIYEVSNLPVKWKKFIIGYLENNIGKHTQENCENHLKNHIMYLDKLDEIRGTNWKETFPEVVSLLKDYNK